MMIQTTRRVWDKKANDFVTRNFTLIVDEASLVDLLAVDAVKNKSGKAKLGGGAVTLLHDGAVMG